MNDRYKCFTDLKNFISYSIFMDLKTTKRFKKRTINGNKYAYKINKDCIIIRNLTKFSSYALIIDKELFNLEYTDFIDKIINK